MQNFKNNFCRKVQFQQLQLFNVAYCCNDKSVSHKSSYRIASATHERTELHNEKPSATGTIVKWFD